MPYKKACGASTNHWSPIFIYMLIIKLYNNDYIWSHHWNTTLGTIYISSMLRMMSGGMDTCYFCKRNDDVSLSQWATMSCVKSHYYCCRHHCCCCHHIFSHKKGKCKVWLLESAYKEALALLALTLVLAAPFAASYFLLLEYHSTSWVVHNLTRFALVLSCTCNAIMLEKKKQSALLIT